MVCTCLSCLPKDYIQSLYFRLSFKLLHMLSSCILYLGFLQVFFEFDCFSFSCLKFDFDLTKFLFQLMFFCCVTEMGLREGLLHKALYCINI